MRHFRDATPTAFVYSLVWVLAVGCMPEQPTTNAPQPSEPGPSAGISTSAELFAEDRNPPEAFFKQNEARYRQALVSAEQWLDKVVVDPLELRKHGIKGKKKLVELFDAYLRLWELAAPGEKPRYYQRMQEIVSVTYERRYHNMNEVDDRHFKQDATSYVRAAYLMEQAGFDTTLYRQEIQKVHPRLNAHMHQRGSHQRMAFHWYYDHFGLDEPFDLAEGYEAGVINRRVDPFEFTKPLDVYHLTHEIFVPYRFGEKLDANFFNEDELSYLRRTLDRVTVYWSMRDNADLVAELVSCMAYLRLTDSEIYREAVDYLLEAQRADGSWGNYDRYRKRYGDYVDQGFYLHTTAVTIDALSVAFELHR